VESGKEAKGLVDGMLAADSACPASCVALMAVEALRRE